MGRKRDQRAITLSLAILDRAAYGHCAGPVATVDVALALTVLLRFVASRCVLDEFWARAQQVQSDPWTTGSCRESYYRVAAVLRQAGWHAPPIPSPPV